ncbi:inorganic pyrophosphatase [Methanomethylovorans hollandica DSM 15978]|jgi:inorganic pyrophosphatase|uniref:inorganic diphosphatase n=1 Tax=Methanomethylovorans hollandica (strain DSM 15978 / NBRC 107637 / DMS1) TaxID=867904 RepID=L0KXD2_METHD|nr:inorganic diphosphatase [Methanomethylovorans hollandica]AGB48644.1 inorganic pyrophosphatase [Methanomethylovorans hollandica DSM 15978]
MKVVIETPKYSFFKYNRSGEHYIKVFFSPVPTIFNYGYIEGIKGADGMEVDAVVLGPRVTQGTVMDFPHCHGVVRFIDDSVKDDKYLFYIDGFNSSQVISFYFKVYALFKTFVYIISKKRISKCKFLGIEQFEDGV